MKALTLATLMRTGEVTRWHMLGDSVRHQTIAEHMYRVHFIALFALDALTYVAGIKGGEKYQDVRTHSQKQRDKSDLTAMSLSHDCTETVTGDLPSPTKAMVSNMLRVHLGYDADWVWDTLDAVKSRRPENADIETVTRLSLLYNLMKLADKYESRHFLRSQPNLSRYGQLALARVVEEIGKAIGDAKEDHPEFDWMALGNELYEELEQDPQFLDDCLSMEDVKLAAMLKNKTMVVPDKDPLETQTAGVQGQDHRP